MHLAAGRDLGHLTYCTNIHAGEPLKEVMQSLARHLPEIRSQFAGDRAMGVGLRLGHLAATQLSEPGALADLKRFLGDGNYYVFTINGFPYGTFHGRTVKENAYKPDWGDPLRLAYTDHLADILSELLPEGQRGSVSTVPCTFKPWAEGRLEAITEHLVRHVAHLVGIAADKGKTLALALEPEPCCYLETIDETVRYFNDQLFSRRANARLANLTGLSTAAAEAAMRRHIGVCYDVCHAAVEFEDPKASIEQLRANGILIAKLQLSSALKIAAIDRESAAHLGDFAEPVYLHQVVEKSNGSVRRFTDLPQALAQAGGATGAEWRVHFHVPIFIEQMAGFGTTQSFLSEILDLHRADPISEHLEVETYTWDVLPASYRNVTLGAAIARELNWVKARLQP